MADFKTTNDYYSSFKKIAQNLGVTGVTGEVLSQLLAQALYFNEVENMSYAQEASLERATLYNSKIQLCMDRMYSVFRGNCPRVYLKFQATKYMDLKVLDKVYTSNNFSLYYLGYVITDSSKGNKGEVVYAPTVISPNMTNPSIIVCLMSKEVINFSKTINSSNTYYVEMLNQDLSNDLWVSTTPMAGTEAPVEVTRIFGDHITNPGIVFDLTIPDFGSRLFCPSLFTENTVVKATVFKYNRLSSYNQNEFKSIKISGGTLVDFKEGDIDTDTSEQSYKGVILVKESDRDELKAIHYQANRERFTSSIMRSNSDICLLLQEAYPDKVSGVTYRYDSGDQYTKSLIITGISDGKATGIIKEGSTGFNTPMTVSPDLTVGDITKIYVGVNYYDKSLRIPTKVITNAFSSNGVLKVTLPTITTGRVYGELSVVYKGDLSYTTNPSNFPEVNTISSEDYTKATLPEVFIPTNGSNEVYLFSTTSAEVCDVTFNYRTSSISVGTGESVTMSLYYLPKTEGVYLSSNEISEFIDTRRSYYIPGDITISPGTKYTAMVYLKVMLYQSGSIDSEVKQIFSKYTRKFGVSLEDNIEEIRSLISKISNVRQVISLDIKYLTQAGKEEDWDNIKGNVDISYFDIYYSITTRLC